MSRLLNIVSTAVVATALFAAIGDGAEPATLRHPQPNRLRRTPARQAHPEDRRNSLNRVEQAKQRRLATFESLPEETKRRIRAAELKAAQRLTQQRQANVRPAAGQRVADQRTGRSATSRPSRRSPPRGERSADGRFVQRAAYIDEEVIDFGPMGPDDVFGYHGSCGPDCGPGCGPGCGPMLMSCGLGCLNGRFNVRAEYLVWSTEGMDVPPLATTDPNGTDPRAVVYGNSEVNDDWRSGGRIALSYMPHHWCGWEMEIEYTGLGEESTDYSAFSNGNLFRPFFNLETLLPDVQDIDGDLTIAANTEYQTLDIIGRKTFCCLCNHRLQLLFGYRYGRLKDEILVVENVTPLTGPAAGSNVFLFDQFGTTNTFNGAVLGVSADIQRRCWNVNLLMKLGIGSMRSETQIFGATRIRDQVGNVTTNAGGLLALPSNIGTYSRDSFAMVPELGITLSRSFGCRWRASFGYSLVYWSDVARAGDQIDLDLNLTQLPPGPLVGTARPNFSFATTDFWAQGFRLGVEYRF